MKKRIAHLIGADMIAQSNRELGDNIIRSNREFCEKMKVISEAEIKSKDRVDISLEEYKRMENTISSLSHEVKRLRDILDRIEVPLDMDIVIDNIQTYWCDDAVNHRHLFKVEFAIDNRELRK